MEQITTAVTNAQAWLGKSYQEQPLATVLIGAIITLLVLRWLFGSGGHDDLVSTPSLFNLNSHARDTSAGMVDAYTKIHDVGGGTVEQRKAGAQTQVAQYYSLVTSMYEWGWGQSFHFAPRFADEGFQESIKRHEYRLSSALGLKHGMRVLDVGCGVGGPARNIARFSGADVTGITIADYQVARAIAKTAAMGLSSQVTFVQGDFMAQPFADATFDAAYAIEATCHAPDRTRCFSEVFRVLKPGGVFGGYEWVMTPRFDASNPVHTHIKHGIEVGDGLPDITGPEDVRAALETAGFIVEEFEDLAGEGDITWYDRFNPSYTLEGFKTTPLGIALTSGAVWLGETLRALPAGTHAMHRHLVTAANTLTEGGKLRIFTPMLYFKARKAAAGEAAPKRRATGEAAAAAAAVSSTRGRSPGSRRK